jgi:hypothetical protein
MALSSEASVPRYAGAAFVAQFSTSLAAGLLWSSMSSGDVGEVLAAVGGDATRVRVVVVLELLTSVGIIALTSLLYVALRDTVRWMATVAFALWLAEATVLAVSMLGLYALLDLAGTGVGPGSAAPLTDTAVGSLALGLREHAGDIAMLLFCAGALLWYPLFIRTRFVPRWLGIWGLAAAVLVCVGTLLNVWDRGLQPPVVLYAAYVPFEFVVGVWLLVKGSAGWGQAVNATGSEPVPQTAELPSAAIDAGTGGASRGSMS